MTSTDVTQHSYACIDRLDKQLLLIIIHPVTATIDHNTIGLVTALLNASRHYWIAYKLHIELNIEVLDRACGVVIEKVKTLGQIVL